MMTALAARSPWRDTLRHLPREARDTLFLLAVIGWTVLPHAFNTLPLWCSALTLGVLLWRGALAFAGGALPGRAVKLGVLLLLSALTWWSYRSLFGREPGITLAVALMALKTLELRAKRDAFVVFFLGFFLVLTQFLQSQSLAVAVAMLGSVWGLLTALVLAHMPAGRPGLWQAARLAGRTTLWGAPLMLLLFVLFPRIGPLWGVPQDGIGRTGLSQEMRMGSVAELAQDERIAFRLRFMDGPRPPSASLYFRGPVLSQFDGQNWRAHGGGFAPPRSQLQVAGPTIRYEVTLEAPGLPLLALLEATPELPPIDGVQTRLSNDLVWRSDRPLLERLRFETQAYTRFRHGPLVPELGLQDLVDLPPGHNPRLLAWAQSLRRQPAYQSANASTLAQAVLNHIRSGGFGYTLAPGLYGEDNPRTAIDEFWFDRKLGFCEHYAAAFVVVMRAMDVPARVVTGYQGTDPQPVDGYWVVRQSAAHAWAEYWQEGRGWVRADPTAAVAPERIDFGHALRPAQGLVAGALTAVNPALLARLRDGWDTVNNRWNQWVLGYARGSQLQLLKNLGVDAPDWPDLLRLLAGALSLMAGGGAVWALWDRSRRDPWAQQMQAIRTHLRTLGLNAPLHEGPRTLALQVRSRWREQADAGAPLAALLLQLDAQRYGRHALPRPDARLTRQIQAAARALRGHLAR
ncbi:MAG: hypothetical protein RJA98_276 [Pseudomonadota bacterium]|jgi:transglutaminase-like putative cysteine protease